MTKEQDITKLIEKYQNGDSLSDSNLASLLTYFEGLYASTKFLPQEFALFRKEIQRMFFQLESYSEARKKK